MTLTEVGNRKKGLISKEVTGRKNGLVSSEVNKDEFYKQRRLQPDRPIHRPQESWLIEFQHRYPVAEKLWILWLLLGSAFVLLHMFGIVNTGEQISLFVVGYKDYSAIPLLLFLNVPVLAALWLERNVSLGDNCVRFLQCVNVGATLAVPLLTMNLAPHYVSPMCRLFVCSCYLVISLKLWSYAQVNAWCRDVQNSSFTHYSKTNRFGMTCTTVKYPDNLQSRDLYYFLLAPTLTYEVNFPRTTNIRIRLVFRWLLELLVASYLGMALIQQQIIPAVIHQYGAIHKMEYTFSAFSIERFKTIELPHHWVLTLFFIGFFHSGMNLVAELLRFSDHRFYNDWWNATDIDDFWRKWNLPVHRWALRHLWLPMIHRGWDKLSATVAVFLFSGFLHQYLISVPHNDVSCWAIMLFLVNIPLSFICNIVKTHIYRHLGRIFLWITLVAAHEAILKFYGKEFLEPFTHL